MCAHCHLRIERYCPMQHLREMLVEERNPGRAGGQLVKESMYLVKEFLFLFLRANK